MGYIPKYMWNFASYINMDDQSKGLSADSKTLDYT